MGAQTTERIRDGALHLLAQVAAARQSGSGELDLEDMIRLTGATPDPELHRRICSRGAVVLDFGADGAGRFHNEGPTMSIPVGPVKLTVPGRLAGSVLSEGETTVFEFAAGATIVGKLLFMEMKLQRLEVSEHHVAVRMPGGMFDQEYRF